LIAGEALLGLLFAGLAFAEVKVFNIFDSPPYLLSLVGLFGLLFFMVWAPLRISQKAKKS
jgi:hypothetical protein